MLPLAERMRPKTLNEYIGQKHLVGQGAILRQMIESGMYLCDDKLFDCCYAASGMYLGIVSPGVHDIIDFPPPPEDEAKKQDFISTRRERIRMWRGREEPFAACKFCNGYDPMNCKRVPAAEQCETGFAGNYKTTL